MLLTQNLFAFNVKENSFFFFLNLLNGRILQRTFYIVYHMYYNAVKFVPIYAIFRRTCVGRTN